ncbi:MAG: hypothetical protein E7Z99_03670 [Coriobacteriaceae bacterium]|nr:hypothetical protein [Coriobacteriaceae bacterium]
MCWLCNPLCGKCRAKKAKARYTLPGLMEFSTINLFLIEAARAHEGLLFDDVEIESVYGGFPGIKLGGGRNNAGAEAPLDAVERLVGRYNELGVACNVTFSNQFATGASLRECAYDRQVLAVLAAGEGNGVIVWSDELARAVRDEFPELKIIASTTKALVSAEDVEDACECYDRVVLDYSLTKDEAFIKGLRHPERIEVMVNEYCTPGCPFRAEHYREVSRAQLESRQAEFPCRHEPGPQAYGFLQGLLGGDVFLRNDDVRRYREKLGVTSFKVVGRGLDRYDIADSYLYYLVQPDCWYDIRDALVRNGFFS